MTVPRTAWSGSARPGASTGITTRTRLLSSSPARPSLPMGKAKNVGAAGAAADLSPAPTPRDWILNGTPEARSKELARSDDRTSHSMVWECTAGRFNWHYNKDETFVVISGEAFITNGQGEERRLG